MARWKKHAVRAARYWTSLRVSVTLMPLVLGICSNSMVAQFESQKFASATVALVIPTPSGPYGGSGFLLRVRSETYLVTARHVVEVGFCSDHTGDPTEVSIQLEKSQSTAGGRFGMVAVPLVKNGALTWRAPRDEMIDLAIVPLPREILKGYKVFPLRMNALASRNELSELTRVGSPVECIGLDAGMPFDPSKKALNKSPGTIAPSPSLPILWTDTCTKPMRSLLLDIAVAHGNSGGPVLYRRSPHDGVQILGPIIGVLSAGNSFKAQAGMVTADQIIDLLQGR